MFGLGLEQIGYNSREFVLSLNFKSSFRQNENIPETNLDEHYICMYVCTCMWILLGAFKMAVALDMLLRMKLD